MKYQMKRRGWKWFIMSCRHWRTNKYTTPPKYYQYVMDSQSKHIIPSFVDYANDTFDQKMWNSRLFKKDQRSNE